MNECIRTGNCTCKRCNANRRARNRAGFISAANKAGPKVDDKFVTNKYLAQLWGKTR